jgi:hypothetical protein
MVSNGTEMKASAGQQWLTCQARTLKRMKMSFTGKGRPVALTVGLLAVMSLLFASSAMAAGKPKGLSIAATKQVNYLTLKATANPNGAATKVAFEKWNQATGKWDTIGSKEIGSGSVPVTTELTVSGGLYSQTEYYYRFSASNTFGVSTSAEETYYSWWLIQGYAEPHEATIGATGKFRMEYTTSGHTVKLECSQTGSGIINSPGGTKDSISVKTSLCNVYDNGKFACGAPDLWFTIQNGYTAPSLSYVYPICAPKEEQLTADITFSEPMQVTASGSGVNVPIKMTANGKFLGFKATFTIESNWFLNGPEVGKTLSLVTE